MQLSGQNTKVRLGMTRNSIFIFIYFMEVEADKWLTGIELLMFDMMMGISA